MNNNRAADFAPGDLVRYVPGHAHGNVRHADCEDGKVTRVEADIESVFVSFDGHPQQPQACDPTSLVKIASIPPQDERAQIADIADRIAKEWADKGRLIEGGWMAYAATLGRGKSIDADTRKVFFLGAEHLYSCIMGRDAVMDAGADVTPNDMRRMALIQEELDRFRRSLVT